MKAMKELSVIQKCYDLVKWYVPIIERFPRVHKFTIGDRVINQLYLKCRVKTLSLTDGMKPDQYRTALRQAQ